MPISPVHEFLCLPLGLVNNKTGMPLRPGGFSGFSEVWEPKFGADGFQRLPSSIQQRIIDKSTRMEVKPPIIEEEEESQDEEDKTKRRRRRRRRIARKTWSKKTPRDTRRNPRHELRRQNPICPDCGTKYEEELVHSWICGHLKELKRLADEGDEEAKSELISKSIKFQIPTYLLKSGSPWKGWADTLFNEDMRIRYAAVALGLSRACTCGSGLPWESCEGLGPPDFWHYCG